MPNLCCRQGARRRLEEAAEGHRLEVAALGRENRELNDRLAKLYEEQLRAARQAAPSAAAAAAPAAAAGGAEELEHLRAVVRAKEISLSELMAAFDTYHEQKEAELGELQRTLEDATAELQRVSRQYETESAEWAHERASLAARLEQVAEAEALLKEHAGLRAEDIHQLRSLLDETRGRLEAATAAHQADQRALEALQEQLAAQRTQADELTTTLERERAAAHAQHARLADAAKDLEAERDRAVQKLAALEEQEAILLRAAPPAGGEASDELTAYLRRQKDALQAEAAALQQDNRRLTSQLSQTMALLDDARARLQDQEQAAGPLHAQMAAEYAGLQARLEALASLRENNVQLAAQVQHYHTRLAEGEAQHQQLAAAHEQATGQLRELQAAEAAHAEHLRLVEADRDAYKARLAAGTPAADPAELQRLAEDRDRRQEKVEVLEAKLKRVLQQCQMFKAQADEHKRRVLELEAVPPAAPADDEARQRVAVLEAELAALGAKLAKFQEALKRAATFRSETQAALAAEQQAHQAAVARLEEHRKEYEMHKQLLGAQHQARVGRLQKQVDDLATENAGLRDGAPEPKRARTGAAADAPPAEAPEPAPLHVEEPAPLHEPHADEPVHMMEEDVESGLFTPVEEPPLEAAEPAAPAQALPDAEADDHDEEEEEDHDMEEEPEDEDDGHGSDQEPPEDAEMEAPGALDAAEAAGEDFDIDQFLADEDLALETPAVQEEQRGQPEAARIAPADAGSPPKAPAGLNRTISLLPTASSVTTTASTFTATPIQAPTGPTTAAPGAGLRRIIDLSQTGRKPIPSTAGTAAAPELSAGGGAPTRGRGGAAGAARGGLARGGKKKFRRGGHAPDAQ